MREPSLAEYRVMVEPDGIGYAARVSLFVTCRVGTRWRPTAAWARRSGEAAAARHLRRRQRAAAATSRAIREGADDA